MKPMKISGACAVIAMVIGMIAAASAHATTPGAPYTGPLFSAAVSGNATPVSLDPVLAAEAAALTRQGIPLGRAQQAVEVQDDVSQEGLITEMEAALGDAYGGAWYEPAAAQLHIGVTSPAAQRVAEAVASRAGLGAAVTETLVQSSSAELAKAQQQFSGRLAGLFEREEVATSVSYQDNSVNIELGSLVPAAQRAALEGEASTAQVEVDVAGVPDPKIRIDTQVGRCRKFEAKKAFCDPTIAGGVRIEEAEEAGCTAGPAVLLKDLSKETTETFILTAGHCAKEVGQKWFAFNKEGKKEEVGRVVASLNEEEGADVGVIKVENAFWKQPGLIPVVPTIAQWSAAETTEPFAVTGEVASAEKAATCISGQSSGFHCGVVAKVKVKIGKLEELVEVEKTKTEAGDSGAPWFSEKEKLVEGTHVGENEANENPVFQALKFSFAQLKAKIDLALLTKANEKRPPCPMK